MRVVSLAEAKAHLSQYLREAEQTGPVVITRNGRAAAVLLSPDDDEDLERLLLSRSPLFRRLLGRSRESVASGARVTHAEFWKDLEERGPHPAGDETGG